VVKKSPTTVSERGGWGDIAEEQLNWQRGGWPRGQFSQTKSILSVSSWGARWAWAVHSPLARWPQLNWSQCFCSCWQNPCCSVCQWREEKEHRRQQDGALLG